MSGRKTRDFKQHAAVSLNDLVPKDNFYRQVEQCINLSFVRDLASEFHYTICPDSGVHYKAFAQGKHCGASRLWPPAPHIQN
jgi:hypothetical protein